VYLHLHGQSVAGAQLFGLSRLLVSLLSSHEKRAALMDPLKDVSPKYQGKWALA
jgi:hypothetical protein